MGDGTKIEWTDATWNPIRARNEATGKIGWYCEHMSEGCRNCYAEVMNLRLGTGLPYKPGHRADVDLFLDEKTLTLPLRWKKPRMIFVCSMTDLFADFVPDEWIDRMFAVMALCPQHKFQVLTKRAKRMRDYFDGRRAEFGRCSEKLMDIMHGFSEAHHEAACDVLDLADVVDGRPQANVWLGVSVEDQATADERIPDLLATPAAIRFVSYEPALGPVDFTRIDGAVLDPTARGIKLDALCGGRLTPTPWHLDWIIAGGESGKNAREFLIEWSVAVEEQCRAAGIPFFRKQLGSRPVAADLTGWRCPANLLPDASGYALKLKSMKGDDMAEWPQCLRVREMPRAA